MPTEKNIKTPEKLYQYFEKYKDYCKKHPKKENFFNHREGKQASVEREVPYTWYGFEIWLNRNGIISKLDDYRFNRDGRYSEYVDITRAIDLEIYEDKYQGAAAGIYQQNIIARDLGLKEKSEQEIKASGLTIKVDSNDKAEAIDKLNDRTD